MIGICVQCSARLLSQVFGRVKELLEDLNLPLQHHCPLYLGIQESCAGVNEIGRSSSYREPTSCQTTIRNVPHRKAQQSDWHGLPNQLSIVEPSSSVKTSKGPVASVQNGRPYDLHDETQYNEKLRGHRLPENGQR